MIRLRTALTALSAVAAAGLGLSLTGPAFAGPSGGTQPHEARIPFPSTPTAQGKYSWQQGDKYTSTLPGGEEAAAVFLDPADYPAGAVFFVRTTIRYDTQAGASSGCERLYDATAQRPVTGMMTCGSAPAGQTRYVVADSGSLQLGSGKRAYVLQGLQGAPEQYVVLEHAELVVRWRE